MKKVTLGLTLMALLFCAGKAMAQAPEQDCFNGISVCQPVYSQANSYSGEGTVEELDGTNQDCLGSGEKNGVWYIINVTSPGNLEFTITPNDLTDDYDFGMWDITGVGCDAIFNYATGTTNPYLPVRCNYSGSPGATGCSNTITGAQWELGLPVNAGQTFALYISNFEDATQNGYTLDFSASTASIYDTVKPYFASALVKCSFVNDHVEVTMSEPVKCSSLAADGSDFSINLPSGYFITSASSTSCAAGAGSTVKYTIYFNAVLPAGTYTITAQNGSDGNTLQDNCGNFQLVGETISFTMNPATPPKIIQIDTPACAGARLILDRRIKCSSVASDGSDFQVSGPSTVNVVSAMPVGCDASGLTDTIQIYFAGSVVSPGTYTLSVHNGIDGDGIADTCGLSVVDPATFVVSDQGGVVATASPNLLCEPGYTQLSSVLLLPPPPSTLVCGPHNGVLAGPSTNATVGSGATGTTNYTPFYGLFEDARMQMVYTAAELHAAGLDTGTITQLKFNITAQNSDIPYDNFNIKIGCTGVATLTGFETGLSQVYGPVSYSTTPGVNTVTLATPFDWDGVSNLVIEICFDNIDWTSSDAVQFTATSTNTVFHRHQDGATGCSMSNTTGTGGASPNRPNITFTMVPFIPGGYGLTWTPSSFVGDTSAQNTVAFVPQTTTYQVQIMDTFRCYRRDTAHVIVSVRQPGLGADTAICYGDAAQLSASGGTTYNWYPADGLSCTNCPNPTASPATTTTYYVAIFDIYGCSDTLSTTVVVNPLPVVNVTDDTTILYGESVPLYAASSGGMYYVWDPVTGLNNPNVPNPIASPLVSTTYTVLVIDTNQCRMTDSVRVTIDMDEPLFVPSAFSPNGDGKNDVFRVTNLTFQKLLEFRVFNRWGQEVFNTNNGRKGWDGTWHGQVQDPGVYQYIIKVSHPDGRLQIFKGDVTLIR